MSDAKKRMSVAEQLRCISFGGDSAGMFDIKMRMEIVRALTLFHWHGENRPSGVITIQHIGLEAGVTREFAGNRRQTVHFCLIGNLDGTYVKLDVWIKLKLFDLTSDDLQNMFRLGSKLAEFQKVTATIPQELLSTN